MSDGGVPAVAGGHGGRVLGIGLGIVGLGSLAFAGRRMLLMSAPSCLGLQWRCVESFNGVVLLTIVFVPVALLVAGGIAAWRRAQGVASAWRLSLAEVGMVYGTVPFVWMTMQPGPAAWQGFGRVSLVPFRDLVTMGWLGIAGNLVVLAALGFFAPIRFVAMGSWVRVLALGVGCSALIETAQYVFQLDRVSSVDDVLVNASGALLAGLASRRWWRSRINEPAG